MATYKVIQDIEAEDKFLGPLTLKQFIFAGAAVFFIYLSGFAFSKNATFLLPIFLPPAFLGAFLAIPWSKDQPTEIWLLAKMRYRLKPKTRIWNQAGLEELVTITAPKKIEKMLTNGLDQTEVRSRLKALAETIDTRGWAVKNATLGDAYASRAAQTTGERLIAFESIPKDVPEINPADYIDVLDEDNAVSANFEHMIEETTMLKRQHSIEKMERIRRGESLDAINQTQVQFAPHIESYDPSSTTDENLLAKQLRNNRQVSNMANQNMRILSTHPVSETKAADNVSPTPTLTNPSKTTPPKQNIEAAKKPQASMTNTSNPDILRLVHENNVSDNTAVREAKKDNEGEQEVVISLR